MNQTECLPGQSAVLELELGGGLLPAGGEFEIHYNERMMTAGTVKAVEKMGTVGVQVEANVDYATGIIKVSWAASEPVTELGRLCTVIFAVDETASGETDVTLENVKCFNESGERLDIQCVNGSVTVTRIENDQPTLYVVGGALQENGTATVHIAVDGAGVACGGTFTLSYDQEKCSLIETTSVKQTAAVNLGSDGTLQVSWAEYSPALDNETILELTFRVNNSGATDLSLSDVKLMDKDGEIVDTTVHSGRIGVTGSVQQPVTSVVNTEKTATVAVTLYDAAFCEEGEQTESAWIICAGYVNGKMNTVVLPSSNVEFDHNGIATVTIELSEELTAMTQIQLFTLSGEDRMVPLCEKVQLSIIP
jgi:hypothetical protein